MLLLAASIMATAGVIAGASAALAQGGGEIFFFLDDPSSCPSASFPGGAAGMSGCATVTSIQATGTPQNSGETLQCFGCTLNFDTGPLTGSNPTQWFFAGGAPGSVVMAGMIEDKLGDVEPPPGDLLTGMLGPSTVTESGSMATFAGQFTGALSSEGFEELNEFYGITSKVYSNSISLTFGIAPVPGDAVTGGQPFTSNPSVPFAGTVVATPVPEPRGALLLGFSLLMGVMFLSLQRRRAGSA
jgi:hypothetical protein